MSTAYDSATLEKARVLLPALHMLVRFPTRTTKVVSFETGCELDDLQAWTRLHGRPTAISLAELESACEGPIRGNRKGCRLTLAQAATPAAPRPPIASRPLGAPAPAADSARNPIPRPPAPEPQTPDPRPQTPPAPPAGPRANLGAWLAEQKARLTGQVTCFQVEVTPALATAWLALNTGNRSASRAKIRRFAAAMASGAWALNGETVKFSATGRLIDGQSRLQAIVLAGVPVTLELRAGLPDAAQQSMDAGELRKGAHMLEMLGEANPAITAAALKLLWLWRKGWLGGVPFGANRVMENAEVAPLLAAHPGLKASAGWTVSTGAKIDRLMPRSEAAFFHYLLGTAGPAARDTFFEALCEGVGLTKVSPAYHLRERLLADRTALQSLTKERAKHIRAALLIKAWAAAFLGAPMQKLTYSPDEAFPPVEGVVNPPAEPAGRRVRPARKEAA